MNMPSKRKSIRFHSTPMSTAVIDLNNKNKFQPSIISIVANESFTGCALVCVCDTPIAVDQIVRVKIGDLDPLNARVVWCKTLDENIKKIGLEFKE